MANKTLYTKCESCKGTGEVKESVAPVVPGDPSTLAVRACTMCGATGYVEDGCLSDDLVDLIDDIKDKVKDVKDKVKDIKDVVDEIKEVVDEL